MGGGGQKKRARQEGLSFQMNRTTIFPQLHAFPSFGQPFRVSKTLAREEQDSKQAGCKASKALHPILKCDLGVITAHCLMATSAGGSLNVCRYCHVSRSFLRF